MDIPKYLIKFDEVLTMKTFLFSLILILLSASLGLTQATRYTTVKGDFACLTLSDFDKLVDYKAVDDEEAFMLLIKGGRCFVMKGGDEVQIMDKNKTGRVVKIRVIGTEVTVWTLKASLTP